MKKIITADLITKKDGSYTMKEINATIKNGCWGKTKLFFEKLNVGEYILPKEKIEIKQSELSTIENLSAIYDGILLIFSYDEKQNDIKILSTETNRYSYLDVTFGLGFTNKILESIESNIIIIEG